MYASSYWKKHDWPRPIAISDQKHGPWKVRYRPDRQFVPRKRGDPAAGLSHRLAHTCERMALNAITSFTSMNLSTNQVDPGNTLYTTYSVAQTAGFPSSVSNCEKRLGRLQWHTKTNVFTHYKRIASTEPIYNSANSHHAIHVIPDKFHFSVFLWVQL